MVFMSAHIGSEVKRDCGVDMKASPTRLRSLDCMQWEPPVLMEQGRVGLRG